jgi:predicted nucleic acid-binding protein
MNIATLELRVVFLDTNVFESAKFKYDSIYMQSFLEVCEDKGIKLLITDVVKHEVIKRINSNIELAVMGIRNYDEKSKENHIYEIFLNSIDIEQISKPKFIEKLSSKLIADFEEFLSNNNLEVVSSQFDNSELINLYFETKAPFNQQKKHEFPDAIILLTIKHYKEIQKKIPLMVSNDKNIKAFCDANDIECYDTIGTVASLLNSESPDTTVSLAYKMHKNDIEDKIKEDILKLDDFVLYSYDSIDEVYVDNIKVVDVNLNNINILKIDSVDNNIELEVVTNITFTCNASYPDADTMGHDKEDGVYYFLQYINASIKIEREVNCVVKISFDEDEFNIDDLDFESKEFEFSLDDRNIKNMEYVEQFGSTRC